MGDQEHPWKGNAVGQKYQMTVPDATPLAAPEPVSIVMDEIAADMREGLLALASRATAYLLTTPMPEPHAAGCEATPPSVVHLAGVQVNVKAVDHV